MNESTTDPLDASADIELILNRLAELVAELDGLCRTLQSEPQSDRANAGIRASGRKSDARCVQPETTLMAEAVAKIEIVDARLNGGGSPAAERIVSAVLPRLLAGVTEVRVSCSIQYDRSQAGG